MKKIIPFDKEACTIFEDTFGVSPMKFLDVPLSAIAGRQVMDILLFDDWIKQRYSLSYLLKLLDVEKGIIELANFMHDGQ